jgi:formylmethanofuran dehydrogenase subunit B
LNQAPVIYNIGSVEDIKGAIHIGPITEAANLEKFKTALTAHKKNAEVVIYCGCCPFGKCPNIRPPYKLLKDLGYTNVKVLNLYVNLRNNWTSAGYPLAKD